MRFHCLQHVEFENPGYIVDWLAERRQELTYTRLFRQEQLPAPDSFDALIIMGGPMSIHDETQFHWLRPEKELIRGAIRQQKKVLGICLGAQLIADSADARVYPNQEKEIGWLPLHWTPAACQWLGEDLAASLLFHWHGETFDLPKDAEHLAFSEACLNQGFRLGENVLALQFHPEVTTALLEDMVAHEGHELQPAPFVQDADSILKLPSRPGKGKKLLYRLLDRFFEF
jgi:GMP synthase-like glutamine amidotransferase